MAFSLVQATQAENTPFTASNPQKDTIEIQIGQNSRVVIEVENKEELAKLKAYDLNKMVEDLDATMKLKSDPNQIAITDSTGKKYLQDSNDYENAPKTQEYHNNSSGDEGNNTFKNQKRYIGHRTRFTSLLDFGMNNYLENGHKFPDESNAQYTVRPWGSWYVSIAPTWQTNLAGAFSLDYGASISWYNFKFQDDATKLTKGDENVIFSTVDPTLNPIKSKLTASYLGIHLVPVFDFGYKADRGGNSDGNTNTKRVFYHSNGFRIGLGLYAGYRLDSYTKNVFKDGNRNKIREHDNFYLNNFRYGVRALLGMGDVDLFVNYDLNELYADGRGPGLNAFSFGLSF